MKSVANKNVLISGASIAGLSTAYWLAKAGYNVTIVELASKPRTGGAAINVGGMASEVARRMNLYESLKANSLNLESWEFKNADDVTVGSMFLDGQEPNDEIEIERDKFVAVLLRALPDTIEFLFNNRITALEEREDDVKVTFNDGTQHAFALVFGCDGLHSGVRKLWFGPEEEYAHFLQHYFSLTIVNKLLIKQSTAEMYNVPGKVIMLNAYNHKTDIVFCFFSEKEIPYDYRDAEQQSQIVTEQFTGQGWRTADLLAEVKQAKTAYFDKFCQVKMPSWTKGRVALIGDAGYCASPAAGTGGSLAMIGAATVADALEKHNGNFELAFQEYNQTLRPFIEEVQANAVIMLSNYLIPMTEEAIQERNTQPMPV